MSSYAGQCGWCGKHVMHKTLLGTLHICLTGEEKAALQAKKSQEKQWVNYHHNQN